MTDTNIALQKDNLPADIEAQMEAAFTELAENMPVGSERISTKGSQFKLPDGTVIGNSIDLVIVDWLDANTLFPEAYDPNNPAEPICYANAKMGEKLIPSEKIENPQCDNCDECPNNEFGSRGQGKACKNEYKVVVCLPDSTDSMIIHLPPTARKDFEKTIKSYSGKFKHPVYAISTFEFDPKVSYPKPVITTARPNDPDMAKQQFANNSDVKSNILNS